MASYWVSQERYFCKYCKVWLSNHKASIRNHDQGKKHVEIVAEFFRKKREDKLKGARSETDLQRQMDNIEKAALRAAEKDNDLFGGSSSTATPPPPPPPPRSLDDVPPPPPPPGRPPSAAASSNSDSGERPPPPPPPGGPPCTNGFPDDETPPPPPPPQGGPPGFSVKREGGVGTGVGAGGVIQDRGQWFLDGRTHQDKLSLNSACQIFAASEGQWVDAVVLSVGEGAPANGTTRRFDIAYFEAGAEKETVVKGASSGELRLPAGKGGVWPPPPEEEVLPPPPPPPPQDENTGLGGWQTVSVRMVDEAAEAEIRRKKEEKKAEKKAVKKAKREEKTERETMIMQAMDADDAMGSYDPWGKGKYRGFNIEPEAPRAPDAALHEDRDYGGGGATGDGEAGESAAPVAFKKRKGLGKGSMRRKPRSREDD